MEFERCRDILLRESELVKKIGALQDVVYKAVVEKDWNDFESRFTALDELGGELSALEVERERVFAECLGDVDDSSRFYAFTARLSPEQRKEITEIYRNLKIETLKVRTAGETLMSYITEAKAVLGDFFEAAFPEKKAKTYSPYGTKASHDMRSMVLNQEC